MNKKLKIINHGEEQWLKLLNDNGTLLVELRSSDYYLTERAVAEVLRTLGYEVEINDLDF